MRFEFFPPLHGFTPPRNAEPWVQRTWRALAPQDQLTLGYSAWLILMAWRGEGAQEARLKQVLLSSAVSLIVLGFRGGSWGAGAGVTALYRCALLAGAQLPYFLLRDLLPAATKGTVDGALHELDVALFGGEPVLWLDAWVTPGRTEWFAFFYFSYFFVLAIHVLPILFLERRGRLAQEFAVGTIGVFTLGQAVYFLLPGYGPYHHLAAQFQHPLPGGFWMDMVLNTVQSGGAMLDIFPSLHTAGPLYIALFSVKHRALRPFRYTWPVALFFSLNIIGATLYLRWHYVIDVLAGAALAFAWLGLAPRLIARDQQRRQREPTAPAWPAPGAPRS
jgi:membrane-associated phospholipid phosphatase